MASEPPKRPLSSPANKDGKKAKGDQPDECVVCAEAATSDVFECSWCEGIQHASCTKLSKEQCNAIKDITSPNIAFFCTTCVRALPITLKQFDNHAHISLVPRPLSFFCVGVRKERVWWISVCGFV